jgi:hypothetical protein
MSTRLQRYPQSLRRSYSGYLGEGIRAEVVTRLGSMEPLASAHSGPISRHLLRLEPPRAQEVMGLFSRAGLESGAFAEGPYCTTVDDQKRGYANVLKALGCTSSSTVQRIACLLKVPALTMLNTLNKQVNAHCGPAVDGVDLTDQGTALAAKGELAPVPILVGSVSEVRKCTNRKTY